MFVKERKLKSSLLLLPFVYVCAHERRNFVQLSGADLIYNLWGKSFF